MQCMLSRHEKHPQGRLVSQSVSLTQANGEAMTEKMEAGMPKDHPKLPASHPHDDSAVSRPVSAYRRSLSQDCFDSTAMSLMGDGGFRPCWPCPTDPAWAGQDNLNR